MLLTQKRSILFGLDTLDKCYSVADRVDNMLVTNMKKRP